MLTFLIMSGCTAKGYYITDNKIKFVHYDYGGTIKKIETPIDADPKTFKPIPKWESIYGKDENSVYRRYLKINKAEPKTFTPLNENFSKDSKRVYYGSKCEVKGADNKTFTPINSYMAKDKFRVYKYISKYDNSCTTALNIIPSTDTASFQLLNRFYSKDKNTVFYENTPIPKANPLNFKTSDEYYKKSFGRDDKHVYYEGKIVPLADTDSFLVMNSTFAKDKNHVYVHNFRVIKVFDNIDVDVASFSLGVGICSMCPKDKNHCYNTKGKVIGCQPK